MYVPGSTEDGEKVEAPVLLACQCSSSLRLQLSAGVFIMRHWATTGHSETSCMYEECDMT